MNLTPCSDLLRPLAKRWISSTVRGLACEVQGVHVVFWLVARQVLKRCGIETMPASSRFLYKSSPAAVFLHSKLLSMLLTHICVYTSSSPSPREFDCGPIVFRSRSLGKKVSASYGFCLVCYVFCEPSKVKTVTSHDSGDEHIT